jgi:hypothetical protein
VQMWVSLSAVMAWWAPADMVYAIVKNGNTGTVYGQMTAYIASNNQPISSSTSIYLDDVVQWDYFEIFVKTVGNETVTIRDISWYIDSK